MDLSRKTMEDNRNRINASHEYLENMCKKRKSFLSHINTCEDVPSEHKESKTIVSGETESRCNSKPEFEKGSSSNACIPIAEESRNDSPSSNKVSSNTISRTGIWAAALPSDTESTPSEKGDNDQLLDPLDVGQEKEDKQCESANEEANKEEGNSNIDADTSSEKDEDNQLLDPLEIDKEKDQLDMEKDQLNMEKGQLSLEKDQLSMSANEEKSEVNDVCDIINANVSEPVEDDKGDIFDEVTRDFIDEYSSPSSEKESDDGNEWFTCKGCKKVFFARKSYNNHRRKCKIEVEQNCPQCKQIFPSMNALKNHMTEDHMTDKSCLCDICGKTYPLPRYLRRHILTHAKTKPYTCEKCGKGFTDMWYLKSHSMSHSDEKPFQCEECGRKFRRVVTLRVHKRTHTKERPYQCDTCGKTFTQTSSLKTHQKIHSGEKPHLCIVCNERFAIKSFLQSHMRTHNKESEEAPSEGKDKAHRCELCGRSFALKNTLKVHMMRHRGERPHKCDVCEKSFTQSSTLKIHMRTHTGDKPYVCDVCDTHFTYGYALQKHILKHQEEGDIENNECSEQEDEGDIKFSPPKEGIVADKEALEEMKQKILQTLANADDMVEKDYANQVKLEEPGRNESDENDLEEIDMMSHGGEDQDRNDKKATPLDFLAAFQSSFKASE